jgi:hypothetical protein
MRIPIAVLAADCLVIGLAGPFAIAALAPAVGVLTGETAGVPGNAAWIGEALWMITAIAAGILVLAALLAWWRARLLAGRAVGEAVTWDCGYVAPTARMQYTASSFADPIARMFRAFLRTRRRFIPPSGLFPSTSSFASDTPDVYSDRMYLPAFAGMERMMARFRWLQHGRLNLYILYIVLALLGLLAWKLRVSA